MDPRDQDEQEAQDAPASSTKPGQHAAAYSRDKRNGGYIVRIHGPYANRFAGREVPVKTSAGEVTMERLTTLLHTGIDEGKYNASLKGVPYALYAFEARPKAQQEEIPF